MQAVGPRYVADSPMEQAAQAPAAEWRPEGTRHSQGCAKLVRTTTRLYIGVGQVREWLGEVGARTELQVKVMLDNRMLYGVHQADLLYNKGAHYYWITSRTLKRAAMGKWFLGWNYTSSDGLVLLLRSPSKDEIAAAIAEGFQAKEDEEETELSEQVAQQQQQQQASQQQRLQPVQQPSMQAFSPPSPHGGRVQASRSLAALASTAYGDEDLVQQQPGPSELDDAGDGGQYQRLGPLAGTVRLGAGDDEDAVSGLSEGHPVEPLPQATVPPLPQRSGLGAMPSQLNATTSIASNPSLAGVTQLTGAPSILQTSGIAGPIVAPLRLPANVSELLPPELLPAAVSVRCTLDGVLLPDVFSCEIHRSRSGHCYLYNLPPSVLDGRSQQDWMISDEGCLVLCIVSLPQQPTLVENISVRSGPSNQAGGLPSAGGSVGAERITGLRGRPSVEDPGLARVQRQRSAVDRDPAARTAYTGSLEQPEMIRHVGPAEMLEAEMAGPEDCVPVSMPIIEPKAEPGRTSLLVPRQAIESLYGAVELPFPVLVRYQVDGELEPQLWLAVVQERNGELVLKGPPTDLLLGRTLVGWRRVIVLFHQLLVPCLETRLDAGGLQARAAGRAAARYDAGMRGEHGPAQQRGVVQSAQQICS
ncbi:hypothetical protein GPECTOR_22g839 [Gonium pectorale]|uniref:Uncharacterized protein n=1 Tax=Gonium pectorale TaxID=33097 RepID=A0A150GHG1_GONPE|nr:hypothetical protein GPECTOR_22g839 [Gonium pectorale]|eukprot:KXZ49247.1 hypothetical protein GPECTOR_22g839 [Gonium pectorale]